jgi:hypothetical protein
MEGTHRHVPSGTHCGTCDGCRIAPRPGSAAWLRCRRVAARRKNQAPINVNPSSSSSTTTPISSSSASELEAGTGSRPRRRTTAAMATASPDSSATREDHELCAGVKIARGVLTCLDFVCEDRTNGLSEKMVGAAKGALVFLSLGVAAGNLQPLTNKASSLVIEIGCFKVEIPLLSTS